MIATTAAANAISTASKAGLRDRRRHHQTAIVEISATRNADAVAQIRQRFQNGVVPKQELQQQRDVTDRLDVAAGSARDEPVLRQPRDAYDEAEHGRKDDA